MGFALSEQLRALGASAALGAALALLYDLLRALRRPRRRGLTDLLDTLYCAALAVFGFFFALRIGDGELRLYMLFGALAGAVLFFSLLSPLLRPLWAFWAETLYALLRLARLPLQKLKILYGKLTKLCKRDFLFLRNSLIMDEYWKNSHRAYTRRRRKGALTYGGKDNKARRRARFPVDCAAARHRRGADAADAGPDRRGRGRTRRA